MIIEVGEALHTYTVVWMVGIAAFLLGTQFDIFKNEQKKATDCPDQSPKNKVC